jgi:hypothetical protein
MSLSTHRPLLFAAVLVIVGGVSSSTVVSTSRATAADPCSIDAATRSFGLTLGASGNAAEGIATKASNAALGEFANATILDSRAAVVRSAMIPSLDGVRAIVMSVDDKQSRFAGGPPGSRVDLAAACTLALYDADTGEFLANLRSFGRP